MRQRCAILPHARIALVARRCAIVLLAAWVFLSTLPFSPRLAVAAPPEPESAVAKPIAAESVAAENERAAKDVPAESGAASRLASRKDAEPGSVRPRGREAPMQLRQEAADEPVPSNEPDDPGDGEPKASRGGTGDNAAEKRQEERQSRGLRVWPMRADSYTFTQAFGCVPQIAHFYQPGAGCPADAPVIHHGIDMAAPEGVPFYAAASGWVTESGYDREVGVANTRIIIQHEGRNDGYATEYLHWIASFVEVGDYVEAGDFIGEVGSVGYSTGPHLHFSIIDLDNGGNLDPVAWLPNEAGNEGYRGRQPKERAEMRLPAGTTAGVPEFTDPAPPAPPERDDLRAAGVDHQGRDRTDRQQKRDRKERKATKRDVAAEEGATGDETASPDESTKKSRKGKDTERTRTRERNKDGQSSEKSARGDDASESTRKERSGKKSAETSADDPAEEDGGKRSEKKHEKRADSEEDPVKQRETNSGDGERAKKKDKRQTDGSARDDTGGATADPPTDTPEREREKRKRKNS